MRYTGHPIIDVGIATITAFAEKMNPEEVTIEDMESIAKYMERNYVVDPLKSFLTVAFPNSGFTQPAYDKNPEKRRLYTNKVLWAFKPDTPTLGEKCIFTGKPAVALSLDVKNELPLGRAYRQHIPLLTGEDVINFHPYGQAGLPISGEALLAIQAFPLGCSKVGGRLLAVHSDDSETIFRFARRFLNENRKAILAAQSAGEKKLAEPSLRLGTLLIDTLIDLEEERIEAQAGDKQISISAYHLSNSGQGVGLDIYNLPIEIIDFLRTVMSAKYRSSWDKLRSRGWELSVTQISKGKKSKNNTERFKPRVNFLYEDLLRLPEGAAIFIRRYFLRRPIHSKNPSDPRSRYSIQSEASLVSWQLTELFLNKVVSMNKQRIDEIRKLGDVFAEYVMTENDRQFFQRFFMSRKYTELRSAILRVNISQLKKGKSPIVKFDPYIEVFEHGEELPFSEWRLIRDLLLIRMVERLYESGWIQSNQSEIPDAEEILGDEE